MSVDDRHKILESTAAHEMKNNSNKLFDIWYHRSDNRRGMSEAQQENQSPRIPVLASISRRFLFQVEIWNKFKSQKFDAKSFTD